MTNVTNVKNIRRRFNAFIRIRLTLFEQRSEFRNEPINGWN